MAVKTPEEGDRLLDRVIASSRNMMIPYYLFASYLYYHRDHSLLTDERYDRLCKELAEELPKLRHMHKAVIDPEALAAGSGFTLADEDYPSITVGAACHIAGIPAPPPKDRPRYDLDGRKIVPEPPKPKKKISFVLHRKTS